MVSAFRVPAGEQVILACNGEPNRQFHVRVHLIVGSDVQINEAAHDRPLGEGATMDLVGTFIQVKAGSTTEAVGFYEILAVS